MHDRYRRFCVSGGRPNNHILRHLVRALPLEFGPPAVQRILAQFAEHDVHDHTLYDDMLSLCLDFRCPIITGLPSSEIVAAGEILNVILQTSVPTTGFSPSSLKHDMLKRQARLSHARPLLLLPQRVTLTLVILQSMQRYSVAVTERFARLLLDQLDRVRDALPEAMRSVVSAFKQQIPSTPTRARHLSSKSLPDFWQLCADLRSLSLEIILKKDN